MYLVHKFPLKTKLRRRGKGALKKAAGLSVGYTYSPANWVIKVVAFHSSVLLPESFTPLRDLLLRRPIKRFSPEVPPTTVLANSILNQNRVMHLKDLLLRRVILAILLKIG
jgi:hypothetical protein